MPEGHVTHRLARALTSAFGGRAVGVSSPQGRFADAAALLDGTAVDGAESVGKHLFVDFEGDRLIWIHLGLIGKLRIGPTEAVRNPGTLRLRIEADGTSAELRGPQWCRLVTPPERDEVVLSSGPDPLRPDADPERAWAKLHRTRRPIGAVLMDQAVFAGVGNIFRAEVLYRHRIDPFLPANELSRPVFDAIWADLVRLMAGALEIGRIDTVRSEHLPEIMGRLPRNDRHGGEVYVYRRANQECHVCGTPVSTQLFVGRNLYWCPTCQSPGSRGIAAA